MDDDKVPEMALLEKLLTKLMLFRYPPKNQAPVPLSEDEIWYIVERVARELQECNALLEIEAPLTICGDTHGQFTDLVRLFHFCMWPPKMRYLFLGDYVDRGANSIETVCLMFLFKMRYPNNFFILRGNHETSTINRFYGFHEECRIRYNVRLWRHFQSAFNSLPIAALVSERILCMHGGLSPSLRSLDQIRNLRLPFTVPSRNGMVSDILWSDPSGTHSGWRPSRRGISYTFGEDVVNDFCEKHNVDMICRAHQVVHDGYDFFANKRLITIFSAPNYCGEFDNYAGMMFVSKNLVCKIRQLKPKKTKSTK